MRQVGDRLDGLGDDIVARITAQARDEADAACIVLEPRIVQARGGDEGSDRLGWHLAS
jgi:hypothetical protein